MRIRRLSERVATAALSENIIMDEAQGLTQLAPGVMIFYGVERTFAFRHQGQGRQVRYFALVGERIVIQPL
jgi:hypothetical protein